MSMIFIQPDNHMIVIVLTLVSHHPPSSEVMNSTYISHLESVMGWMVKAPPAPFLFSSEAQFRLSPGTPVVRDGLTPTPYREGLCGRSLGRLTGACSLATMATRFWK